MTTDKAFTLQMFTRSWWADIAALMAGSFAPLAFAPYDQGWLMPLLLAVLFLTWIDVNPRRAMLRGWLFGLPLFLGGVYWLYTSMFVYGRVDGVAAVFFVVTFSMLMALFPALSGFAARRWFSASLPVFLLVSAPACWVLLEWVRGWFLTGFTWMQVGYTQTGMPLQGAAPLLGIYGVAWLLLMTAGALVWLVLIERQKRMRIVIGVISVWAVAGVLNHTQWTTVAGKSLKVSLLRGNVDQNKKWLPFYRRDIIDKYKSLTRKHWSSDIIVWPETAVPAYYHRVAEQHLTPLAKEALRHNTHLLIGVPFRNPGKRYFNSVVALSDGVSFYHKRHLVPFGEYVPFRKQFKELLGIMKVPMADFSVGKQGQQLVRLAGYPVSVAICYEIAFGSEVAADLPQAAFIVNVSNNAWFGRSGAAAQQLQMAQMRARELERDVVVSTNDGLTALVSASGRVIKTLPRFRVAVLTGSVTPRKGSTPYVIWGDWFVVLLMVGLLGLVYGRADASEHMDARDQNKR